MKGLTPEAYDETGLKNDTASLQAAANHNCEASRLIHLIFTGAQGSRAGIPAYVCNVLQGVQSPPMRAVSVHISGFLSVSEYLRVLW